MRGIPGIGDRLKLVRQSLAKTQGEIAADAGAKQRSWQEYEAEKTTPGSKVIAGLVRLGFNANWILTGEGPMRLDELAAPGSSDSARLYAKLPRAAEDADKYGVDSAISPTGIASMAFDREWLESIGVPPHEVIQIIMPDDGMWPTIPPGALVVADGSVEAPDRAGLYVMQTAQSVTVVRFLPAANEWQWTITHTNEHYRDMNYIPEFCTVLGRVIWYGGPVR